MVLKVKRLLKEVESFRLLIPWSFKRAIASYTPFTSVVLIDISLNKKAKAKWTLVAIEKWRHF